MNTRIPRGWRWGAFPRFSLVELLVVMAIMATLASILLPALEQAKQKGKQMLCATTMKTMGNYFMMYANDYDAYLPKYNDGKSWYERLIVTGYVKSIFSPARQIYSGFDCPMERETHINCNSDYAVNIRQFHGFYNQNLLRIPLPSECMLSIDAWDMYWTREPAIYAQYVSPRHNKGSNTLYGDFHVGWYKYPVPTSQSNSFWGGVNQP